MGQKRSGSVAQKLCDLQNMTWLLGRRVRTLIVLADWHRDGRQASHVDCSSEAHEVGCLPGIQLSTVVSAWAAWPSASVSHQTRM